MGDRKLIQKYLPMTESTYYIMLALVEPLHGYGIMQDAERRSNGAVSLGPGTLYGALSTLEREGLINLVCRDGRRKIYRLAGKGRRVLELELSRLQRLVDSGMAVVHPRGKPGEGG